MVSTVSTVQGCLRMDPSERLTCEQLLLHPYFESLREKSQSSSREQDRSRRRLPRKHLPPGVKICFIQIKFNISILDDLQDFPALHLLALTHTPPFSPLSTSPS